MHPAHETRVRHINVGCIQHVCGKHLECMQDASKTPARCIWDVCKCYLGAELYRIFKDLFDHHYWLLHIQY